MEIHVIVFSCLLLAFLAFLLYKIIKYRDFISKNNAFYFIPLLILVFIGYSFGYYYANKFYDISSVVTCLYASLKSFAFVLNKDCIDALASVNFLYKISMYVSLILCGLTTVATVLGFVKVSVVNFFRFAIQTRKQDVDFIIGIDQDSIEFAKRVKNAIVLIEKGDKVLSPKLKEELFDNKVIYFKTDFTAKKIKRILRCRNGKYNIFEFNTKSETLNEVIQIIKNIKLKNNQSMRINVAVNDENILYVNKLLTEACDDGSVDKGKTETSKDDSKNEKKIMASSFNLYNIIGRQFSFEHNLAEFLPRDFIENGTLKKDKNIEVIMLGAGKTSLAVMRYLIMNNQFVTVDGDKFKLKQVKYTLIDNDDRVFDNKIVNLFSKKRDDLELGAIVEFKKANIRSSLDDILVDNNKDKNTFRYYFINVGNSLDNQTIVNSLYEQKKSEKYAAFYCVDSKKEIIESHSDKRIMEFGFKDDLLTKDNILNDKNFSEAEEINKIYNNLKGSEAPFSTLNIVEKLSNFYANMNREFKLNLIGLTMKPNGNKISKEEFDKIYFGKSMENKIKEYNDYFKINVNNALRYEEHARWNTYYYINGFKVMNNNEITINQKGELKHKNLDLRTHACLRDYYELNDVFKYEANLKVNGGFAKSFDEALSEVEAYKYDSQTMDDIIKDYEIYRKE